MIGLDTNVLVRYIAQDDRIQSAKATRLIESLNEDSQSYIGVVAVIELVWVLSSCYGADRNKMGLVLETLLRTKGVQVEAADTVWQALRLFRSSKADFADCLIERSAQDAGCSYTATFDQNAAKYCGMQIID